MVPSVLILLDSVNVHLVGQDPHAMFHVPMGIMVKVAAKCAVVKIVRNAEKMTDTVCASLDSWEQIVKMYVQRDTTDNIVLENVHANPINLFAMLLTVAYVAKGLRETIATHRNGMLKNK